MDKPRSSAAPIFAAILLLLPVLYIGSYFALVIPAGKLPKSTIAASLFASPQGIIQVSHYRLMPAFAARFYWPLEQLDRKLRPKAWREFKYEWLPIGAIQE